MSSRTEQCINGCGVWFSSSEFWRHAFECPALWDSLRPLLDPFPSPVEGGQ
jgi:hypothetical protein